MGRSKVVIADTDAKFLLPLELRFLAEMNDDIDLEIISEMSYFETFFSQPQKIDVLIINEKLFSPNLQMHSIGNYVVMLESNAVDNVERRGIYTINKYTSIDDIFNFAMSLCETNTGDNLAKNTEIVLIASASGGTGKTTIAMGLCQCLTDRYKKVLYVNAENMNSFQHWMNDEETIPISVSASIGVEDENLFELFEAYIKSNRFDYIPSFSTSLMSLNTDLSIYERIIEGARASQKYDVIVVDTDATFDFAKLSLIAKSDKVLMVMNQSKSSVYAMNHFVKNVSCNNGEKFFFICNDYRKSEYDAIRESKTSKLYSVNEYVEHIENIDTVTIEQLGRVNDLYKLSFLII